MVSKAESEAVVTNMERHETSRLFHLVYCIGCCFVCVYVAFT